MVQIIVRTILFLVEPFLLLLFPHLFNVKSTLEIGFVVCVSELYYYNVLPFVEYVHGFKDQACML